MNGKAMLLAASWIDTAIVGAILLAATIFLGALTFRFFRGQVRCSCDRRTVDCPAVKAASALDRMTADAGRDGGDDVA
jgi:hypothetical protein